MKILIIRFSSIGDIIICTPIIRCTKLQLGAEIHFLTLPKNISILQANPYIDEQLPYDGYWQTLKTLKENKYDAVIDLHKSRLSRMITAMLFTRKFTFDKLNLLKWLYVNFKWNKLPNKHLVDRYFEGLNELGISNDGKGLDFFFDKGTPILLPKVYNVLVLGAAHATKRIPASIATKIIHSSLLPVVLLGGNDVIDQADQLIQESEKVISFIGKTSLDQAAQILQKADHIWTGDTGLMHMAAALKKPMTVMWGNTVPSFGMYPYYGSEDVVSYRSKEVSGLPCRPCSKLGFNVCPKGHFKCMMDQKVE